MLLNWFSFFIFGQWSEIQQFDFAARYFQHIFCVCSAFSVYMILLYAYIFPDCVMFLSYFGHNRISELPASFKGAGIAVMDLTYNSISVVPSSFLAGFSPYTRSFILFDNNQIQSLPEFSSSMPCYALSFSYNNITKIPGSFSSVSSLNSLFVLSTHSCFNVKLFSRTFFFKQLDW